MNWISINDKLPPVDTPILCYYFNYYMEVMEYWGKNDKGEHEFICTEGLLNEVTHWMQLPSPPKNEK